MPGAGAVNLALFACSLSLFWHLPLSLFLSFYLPFLLSLSLRLPSFCSLSLLLLSLFPYIFIYLPLSTVSLFLSLLSLSLSLPRFPSLQYLRRKTKFQKQYKGKLLSSFQYPVIFIVVAIKYFFKKSRHSFLGHQISPYMPPSGQKRHLLKIFYSFYTLFF